MLWDERRDDDQRRDEGQLEKTAVLACLQPLVAGVCEYPDQTLHDVFM